MTIDTPARPTTVEPDRRPPGAPTRPPRDRSIDRWRALALVRVVAYHATGFGWMTVVFPAMGLMFALAGSLTARSLDRGSPVVRGRLRRLVPALWLFGAVAVPVTSLSGWGERLDEPAERWSLLFWILPLHMPPTGAATFSWAFSGVLWYLVTYVWFVILSPALLRAFRAWPVRTLAIALALPAILHLRIVSISGFLEFPLRDLTTYGACWILGFAHRDGWLRAQRVSHLVMAVAGLALVAAVVVAREAPELGTADLNHLPLANAWWSAAFCAVVLRVGWPGGSRAGPAWLERLVWMINARAVTIYLWHFPCLFLAREIAARLGSPVWTERLPVSVILVLLLLLVAMLTGWVEDLAAGRPVGLLPRRIGPVPTPPVIPDPARRTGIRPILTKAGTALVALAVVVGAATFFERWPRSATPTNSDDRQPASPVERRLTDLPYTAVANGLGPVERNRAVGGPDVDDGQPIMIGATVYEHGLGVHAPSRVRVYLNGQCSRFSTIVGLDPTVTGRGSVRFQVVADGTTIYRSDVLTSRRDSRAVDLSLDDVVFLDLVVEDGGDGPSGDAANWADARLWCTD